MSLPNASIAGSSSASAPSAHRPTGLQGVARRVLYVALYELIAIAAATVALAWLTGQGSGHSSVVAVAASAIAVVWNLVFNWAFERWEARQPVRGRSTGRRIAHAIGFEGGLVFSLVPLFAWWFEVSLWQAFVMDLGLIAFFLCYTFVFNWGFDRIFGLPASAQAGGAAAGDAAQTAR
ncbi:Uncharacterized membrane protein [Paracidovorax valerianellae]|uniref:Uncharacterized membrane protein n=1 Tax=Paracidovorax valerianellae TaxID=187868 RepID=A0A1G6XRT1_9BURK|nr:Uncharacterized membrane protein [Paracidovorax valerianellae]